MLLSLKTQRFSPWSIFGGFDFSLFFIARPEFNWPVGPFWRKIAHDKLNRFIELKHLRHTECELWIRDFLDFLVNSTIQFLNEAKREQLALKFTHQNLRNNHASQSAKRYIFLKRKKKTKQRCKVMKAAFRKKALRSALSVDHTINGSVIRVAYQF